MRIKKNLLTILALLIPMYVANAQETQEEKNSFINLGYNAIQSSIELPNSWRFRGYNNFDFRPFSRIEIINYDFKNANVLVGIQYTVD